MVKYDSNDNKAPKSTIKSLAAPEGIKMPAEAAVPNPIRSASSSLPPPPPVPAYSRDVAARARKRQVRRRTSGSDWALVVVAAAMLGIVVMAGLVIALVLQSSKTEPEILPTASADLSQLPTAISFRTGIEQQFKTGEVVELEDGYTFVLEPWDGRSRFTILAMGLDRRPGEIGLMYRTDTMMVISIEPDTQRIGILSIPRDLYVAVPGYASRQRVNAAMVLGEAQRGTTGTQLAMETVQYNLGIRIHDYLIVDFQAVIDFINAIDGIEVTIDYTINDPGYPNMNYGYDPFYLAAGTHHLMGYDALRFARTRHGNSDIDRTRRQQQVIYAVRDRILNFELLPRLIYQAPTMFRAFEEHVYTSLALDDIIRLAWYVKDIPRENITTGVINYEYLQTHETPDGQQVLILNQWRIGNLMAQVFGESYGN